MKHYVVKPGSKVKLADWDPRETGAFSGGKEKAEARLLELNGRLEALQELLDAEHKHRVLVILQALDTGGKDGTIRKVFDRVNPQGVRVASFKAPTPIELDHDYLWRVHQQTPGRGEIVVFNRSHYEDVLVARVHGLVPPEVWKRRYAQINDFERLLSEEGTTLLKFYLHIDQDEQKERLQERLDDPKKRWKFNAGDLEERKLWDEYAKAYEDVLERTSTEWAPWRIIPANRNWYRNLMVAEAIVGALERLEMRFPDPQPGMEKIVIE